MNKISMLPHIIIIYIFSCNLNLNNKIKTLENVDIPYSKISIITKSFLDYYPGNIEELNEMSKRPDTMVIYESKNFIIIQDHAIFSDHLEKMNYDRRNIYAYEKETDSIYLVLNGNIGIIPFHNRDSIWQKVYRKASNNTPKLPDHYVAKFDSLENRLLLVLNDKSNDFISEEFGIDSIFIYFDSSLNYTNYSISKYYDNIGFGKVSTIEFRVNSFYSKIYKRKIEAFSFYDKLILNKSIEQINDLKFIDSILNKVNTFKALALRYKSNIFNWLSFGSLKYCR